MSTINRGEVVIDMPHATKFVARATKPAARAAELVARATQN